MPPAKKQKGDSKIQMLKRMGQVMPPRRQGHSQSLYPTRLKGLQSYQMLAAMMQRENFQLTGARMLARLQGYSQDPRMPKGLPNHLMLPAKKRKGNSKIQRLKMMGQVMPPRRHSQSLYP